MTVLLAVVGLFAFWTLCLYSSTQQPVSGASFSHNPSNNETMEARYKGSKTPIFDVSDLKDSIRFFHISDTHVDPFFDPKQSMGVAMCHNCAFNDKVHGEQTYCPTAIPSIEGGEEHLVSQGYAFGRYQCNPPKRLLKSLFSHLKSQDPDPEFIVITGDIAPHGYPGDKAKVDAGTKLDDLCNTKFLIFQQQVRYFRQNFPNTKFVFTMGNNDHFPKNTYWQPYMTALGDMFLEENFINQEQHDTFVKYGSFVTEAAGIRFLSIDLSLFAPGGETSFVDEKDLEGLEGAELSKAKMPVRTRTLRWLEGIMEDSKQKGIPMYLVGHQPLATKKGKNELDVEGIHFGQFKNLLAQYSSDIKLGLFGHRNLAGLQEILSPLGRPLIPSITVPGVSPRGKNQPCFNVLYANKDTKVIQEFEQWTFNLMDENAKAKNEPETYLGSWRQHHSDVYSWRALSGETEFTPDSLSRMLARIPTNSRDFFAIEVWKRAGYIGDETPEDYKCKSLYDTNDGMMRCLFPDQDVQCWDDHWLA